MDGDELGRRLSELGVATAPLLTSQQRSEYQELVWASEYGLALEFLSDWLSEDEVPDPTHRARRDSAAHP